MTEVPVIVDGERVDYTLFPAGEVDEPRPAFIFFHGWTSSKERYLARAQMANSLGITTVAMSFRGHGESEGDFEELSRLDHLRDAMGIYNLILESESVDSDRVGVFGASYGGYLAALLSKVISPRYLALWDPALYPDNKMREPTAKLIEADPDIFKQSGFFPEGNGALTAVSNFSGDLLLLRSEQTDVVPLETFQTYARYASKDRTTVVVVEGTNHALTEPGMREKVDEALYSWIKEKIS